MFKPSLEFIEFDKWDRKILYIYWLIFSTITVTEVILYFFAKHSLSNSQWLSLYVIRPLVLNLSIMTSAEIIYFFMRKKHNKMCKYLIIISGTLITSNIVYVHCTVQVIYTLFVFPIFLSVFYGSKKLTYITVVLNLFIYVFLCIFYIPTRPGVLAYRLDFNNFITCIAIIGASVLLALSFLDRAKEIVDSVIEMNKEQEVLSIKNFVMEFNSKIEPATGLFNHKTFYEYLYKLISQSEKYGFPLSLAVIDIDNFKRVNDTYGHSAGDDVIKSLAEIIKSTIGSDDYAARYGGEEFAIIFTDRDKHKAFEKAEEIRIKFNEIKIDDMKDESFGVSIGVSEHIKGMKMQEFFDKTDGAQYRAKQNGKNKTMLA